MSSEQQTTKAQSIVFPNGNHALVLSLSSEVHVHALTALLQVPAFCNVVMLVGGAGFMEDAMYQSLAELFTQGIALLAATHNALIIDGGTQSGVMELMGLGAAAQQYKFPLLGVAPAGLVSYPGQSEDVGQEERGPLDPNHSHFVLVQTEQWGGETATMYALAQMYSQNCPSVAILVNGGAIAIQEVLYNVRQQRPILVLQGSGRAADDIARLWQEKPATIADPNYAEIIQHGDIHLFPAAGSASDLIGLTLHVLHSSDK